MGVTDGGTLHHMAWVVDDLDETARSLARTMDLEWAVWTIEPEACTVRGEVSPFSFRVAIASAGSGNLELIEPVSGDSVYVEHLEAKGPGYHHACLAYESRAALASAREALLESGRDLVQSGEMGEAGEFCYFAIPETGSFLELLYLAGLPPPERTIG